MMFPCQRILCAAGREIVHNKLGTSHFLRQSILRKHSVLSATNVLRLDRVNFTSKNQQTSFSVPSAFAPKIPIGGNAVFYKDCHSSANPGPQTPGQKLKRAVAEYGSVVIVFHVGISLISLGICYSLVSSGLDLAAVLSYLGLNIDTENKLATNTGSFVVAYAVHKVFAPARIGVTLTAAPFIVRYLRRAGWLKQVPKKMN